MYQHQGPVMELKQCEKFCVRNMQKVNLSSPPLFVDDVPSQGPHPVLYERIDGPLIHSMLSRQKVRLDHLV